ncbi:PIG-X [Trametes polyzona]|nr:PIG-X [Trametes polyzona]
MASLASSVSAQGFHFTVSTTINVPDASDLQRHTLHVVFDLDPHVYADQYELAQRPGYTSQFWGTTDLEKPVSAVNPNGTVLLLTADTSELNHSRPVNITLEVPLHVRYGRPIAGTDSTNAFHHIPLQRPLGFLASKSNSVAEVPEALRPYTALSGWPTSIHLIPDASAAETLGVTIPVGVLDDLAWVDIGTATVMLAMFFYLLHASVRTAQRLYAKSSTKTD